MSKKSSTTVPQKKYWPAGGDVIVHQATHAALAFVAEHSRLLDFNTFFMQSKLKAILAKSLKETDELKRLLDEIGQYDGLISEVIICRVVDNFLTFISDLLALIYKYRPEMLKCSEQERLDFILQFDSMDELRMAIAEKRVERLAYLGLRDLSDYLKTNMSFELFLSIESLNRAALLIEYRNLYVHNRGVVSQTSVRRFPELKKSFGKRITIDHTEVRPLRQFLENAVFCIDERAIKKFSLPSEPIPEPPSNL